MMRPTVKARVQQNMLVVYSTDLFLEFLKLVDLASMSYFRKNCSICPSDDLEIGWHWNSFPCYFKK
jgi:hypothetical protein